MTPFDLDPVLLFMAVLGLAILWRLGRLAAGRLSRRRLAAVAVGSLGILLVVSLGVRFVAPGQMIASSRLLNWKLNDGAFGSLDPASVQTTTVVTIEVEHPSCAPIQRGPWLADPIVSATPWSVTITMHMSDTPDVANCSSQQTPRDGTLPIVGTYLTGIFVPVHLPEPLGGRGLFDGSSFPPAARSLP